MTRDEAIDAIVDTAIPLGNPAPTTLEHAAYVAHMEYVAEHGEWPPDPDTLRAWLRTRTFYHSLFDERLRRPHGTR